MLEVNLYRKFMASGIHTSRWVLALALATLVPANQLHAEDFESVLEAPARYDHKRVTVTGILVGDASFLELFRNASDAKAEDARKSVRLVLPDNWQQQAPYDMRRARVVGIVDANVRSRWGYPFELKLEKLVILSGRVMPCKDSAVVFYNGTEAAVLLRVGVPPRQTELLIPPTKHDGFLSLELQYSTLVQVMTANGKPIFESKINVGPKAPDYDAKNCVSCFRIKDKRIERVSPATAANWGWKR